MSGKMIPRSCAFLGSSTAAVSVSSRSSRAVTSASTSSSLRFQRKLKTITKFLQHHCSNNYYNNGPQRIFSSHLSAKAISSDESAISKSRIPFRMPKNSTDDSSPLFNNNNNKHEVDTGTTKSLSWNRLGLLTELCNNLRDELYLPMPTPVQSLVIPQLLKEEKESLAFLAATGSGKTLAYVLPLIQQLKHQEMFESYERRPKRPRVLILAPTRELATQITAVIKSLSHSVKLSTQALVGGVDKGTQRKALENRPVDVVVATPGRLLQQWKNGNLFLGAVQTIVLDEMDTMLEQGFQRELREIMYPLLYNAKSKVVDNGEQQQKKKDGGWGGTTNNKSAKNKKISSNKDSSSTLVLKETAPQIVMTSATMTQSVQKLLGENPKTSKLSITAKRLHGNGGGIATNGVNNDKRYQQQQNNNDNKLQFPPMTIVSTPGLHKAVPRLEQIFVDVGNTDKISLLLDVIASQKAKATIVFCNTASSVRAVQYAFAESRIQSLGYHGDLNSVIRTDNLKKFRTTAKNDSKKIDNFDNNNILVCTDIAARGLDIPQVDNVVMFDFPLNAMDYLHRSGRTARGTGKGRVTALVAKRDKVLATGIEQAVLRGETLDGISSRKSDYMPGARFGAKPKSYNTAQKKGRGRRGSAPRDSRRR